MGSEGHFAFVPAPRSAQEIRAWLTNRIAEELGLSPDEVGADAAFESFGMASRDAVMLSGDLEEWLDRSLSPTLLWEYPTIATLASHLAGATETAPAAVHSGHDSEGGAVAIIGIGCRFPGASDPDALWHLLHDGVDAITEVPAARWDIRQYYDAHPGAPGKMCTKWGGFLDGIDQFDPQFFGISPREAVRMDPQQRLLLETSWEALERAGQAPDALAGSATGVFIGISTADYAQLQFGETQRIDAYAGSGNALSIAANRISYFLDLRGPSMALDTACSSSLVAVHWACRSLLSGESTLALAGGVNLTLAPETTITFSQARMMATDGRCKTFDASADGYVRGEGCGVVVLKRLSNAIRDGDPIVAVIRGTAINHDGHSNGLTAPNGLAQQAVVRQALQNAGVAPQEISYVEAHGTGTSLGDPIEVESLKAVFLDGRSVDNRCALGSIKTNIGHLESAAGIAGLIKVALSLQHEEIPPHLHLKSLNPLIDIASTPLWIPTEPTSWPRNTTPRRAGVSAFGFGGTNAHAVLEEAPRLAPESDKRTGAPNVLCLSAQTDDALQTLAGGYAAALSENPELDLNALCYTAATGRSAFGRRLAIVSQDAATLRENLKLAARGESSKAIATGSVSNGAAPKIAFLFTGQGSQYPGMGRRLYETEPVFRDTLDACATILRPHLDSPLLEVLFASSEPNSTIHLTANSQPALFALEYGLAALWRSWGIVPEVVLGHSVGEYVAACVAGAFTLEEGLALIVQRAKLMQALPPDGTMMAVFAAGEAIASALRDHTDRVAVAAVNGPDHTVLSGDKTHIAALTEFFAREGVATRPLTVSHAFHSPLLDPMLEELQEAAGRIDYRPLQIPLVSNRTGAILEAGSVLNASYWRQHARDTVQFQSCVQAVAARGCDTFIELGPHPVLLGMGARCVPTGFGAWLPSMKKEHDDCETLARSVAQLYVRGANIDWRAYHHGRRRPVAAPTYPFQRQRYWFDAGPTGRRNTEAPGDPSAPSVESPTDCRYELEWRPSARPDVGQSSGNESGSWLIFADAGGVADALVAQLTERGENCVVIGHAGSAGADASGRFRIDPQQPHEYAQVIGEALTTANPPCRGLVHLWSLDVPSSTALDTVSLAKAQALSCESVLHVLHILSGAKTPTHPRLWVVTRGVQPADAAPTALSVAQSPVWGLGRSAALEHPQHWGGLIDLDADFPPNAQALCDELLAPDDEDQIALRASGRRVARLVRREAKTNPSNVFRADGTYLITGGLGDLGLMLARWMADCGARRLVLLARTALPPRTEWDTTDNDRAKRTIAAIRDLEARGVTVTTVQADVADRDRMAGVFAELAQSLPAIRGVIHAAGSIRPLLFRDLDVAALREALRPKVEGAWNLHELSRELPLDFFVLFSSIASVWGSKGLAHYAAANHFLDTLAHHRRALGLPALSMNWGPWEGSSGEAEYHAALARMGLSPLVPALGLALLGEVLGSEVTQQSAAIVDWTAFRRVYEIAGPRPFLTELTAPVSAADEAGADESVSEALSKLLEAPHAERKAVLEKYLQVQVGRVLHLGAEQIPVSQDLMSLGLDSLMIMEVIADVSKDFKIKLYPREVFERPTIEALSEYIALEFNRDELATAHDTAALEPNQSRVRSTRPDAWRPPARKIPGIVFLLSSPRSGSTLLRVMLAGHPELFCPPELHLLPFSTMGERERTLGATYLGEGLLRAFMELNGSDAAEAGALVGAFVERDAPIQDVYALLQDRAGTRRLVDKSPTYATARENLDHAEASFDGAKYIHLVRHPYAVIESFVRSRMDKMLGLTNGNPFVLAERIWLESNRNTRDFAAVVGPERCHQVQYEALVADPRQEMTRLCAFLGVPFHEAVLRPYEGRRMTEGIHAQSLPIGDPNFKNHDGIDATLGEAWKWVRAPRNLMPATVQLAGDLGYELPRETPASNAFADSFAAIEEGRL